MPIFSNLSKRRLAYVLCGLGDTAPKTADDWLDGKLSVRPSCDERLTAAALELGVDPAKYRTERQAA